MKFKYVLSFLLVGITASQAFGSSELTVPGENAPQHTKQAASAVSCTSCSCLPSWMQINWSRAKKDIEQTAEAGVKIGATALKIGGIEVAIDLANHNIPEAIKDALSALKTATEQYAQTKASDPNATTGDKAQADIITLSLTLVDGFAKNHKLDAVHKEQCISAFGNLLDLFEPAADAIDEKSQAIRVSIGAAKAALFDLINGKKDAATIVPQIQEILQSLKVESPTTNGQLSENTAIDQVSNLLKIVEETKD